MILDSPQSSHESLQSSSGSLPCYRDPCWVAVSNPGSASLDLCCEVPTPCFLFHFSTALVASRSRTNRSCDHKYHCCLDRKDCD